MERVAAVAVHAAVLATCVVPCAMAQATESCWLKSHPFMLAVPAVQDQEVLGVQHVTGKVDGIVERVVARVKNVVQDVFQRSDYPVKWS